jgi:hypothetical protein
MELHDDQEKSPAKASPSPYKEFKLALIHRQKIGVVLSS